VKVKYQKIMSRKNFLKSHVLSGSARCIQTEKMLYIFWPGFPGLWASDWESMPRTFDISLQLNVL